MPDTEHIDIASTAAARLVEKRIAKSSGGVNKLFSCNSVAPMGYID